MFYTSKRMGLGHRLLGLDEHHYFFKDHWIHWALFVLAVSQLLLWVITGWVVSTLPQYVALKATIYFGISLFGESALLWHLPLLGLCFAVINIVVASRVYAQYRWLTQQVLAWTILWQWCLMAALWWIVLLNRT